MELKDTIALMTSEDYKERFQAEYYQTVIRTKALGKMLKDYAEGTLTFTPKCSYNLLNEQYKAMVTYAAHLLDRAEIEGIELKQI